MKQLNFLNRIAHRTGWPVGAIVTVMAGILLSIAQVTQSAAAFMLILVAYFGVWFIYGKNFFKPPVE